MNQIKGREFFDKEFTLEVWGPYACFTRPELKVERVSYDVITPSAARAIFEAIFWKPAIHWQVTKIEVLNPIKWVSIKRNEVSTIATTQPQIYIEDNRTQKNTLMLQDVRYRISARLEFIPMRNRVEGKNGIRYERWYDVKSEAYKQSQNPHVDSEERENLRKDENPAKYNAMFERRASKGQCFTQPYLGTRECVASFQLVKPDTDGLKPPIGKSCDLGIMLYDMDFENNPQKPEAMFFRAKMEKGVIVVPLRNSEEVLR